MLAALKASEASARAVHGTVRRLEDNTVCREDFARAVMQGIEESTPELSRERNIRKLIARERDARRAYKAAHRGGKAAA